MAFNWLEKKIGNTLFEFNYKANSLDEPEIDKVFIDGEVVEVDNEVWFMLEDYLVERWLKREL